MTADILKLRDQMRENVNKKKKFIQMKTSAQDKAKQLIALKQSRNKDKSNEKTCSSTLSYIQFHTHF